MRSIEILNEIYENEQMDHGLELYNEIFHFLLQGFNDKIENLISEHAALIFSSEVPAQADTLFTFFSDLERFFTNISEIFILFDDDMRVLKDRPSYTKYLYLQHIKVDFVKLAQVFLRSYDISAELARNLYEKVHIALFPFTERFDNAVTAVFEEEFDAFFAKEFAPEVIPYVALRALTELRSFSSYCKVEKLMFTRQNRLIFQKLILNNEALFLEAAVRDQNIELYKIVAQRTGDEFGVIFANFIDELTQHDIMQMDFGQTSSVLAKYRELFDETFGADAVNAANYLISNVRAIKAKDIEFELLCCEAVLRDTVEYAELIVDDAVMLLMLVAFASENHNQTHHRIIHAVASQNAYLADVMRYLSQGQYIPLPVAWSPLEMLRYQGKIALGTSILDVEGHRICVPTTHALFLTDALDLSKMPFFEGIIRFQSEEFIEEVAANSPAMLVFDMEIQKRGGQRNLANGLPELLQAAICRFVKQNEPCSAQDLCRSLYEYESNDILQAVRSLLGTWIDEGDDGRLTWAM